MYKIIEISLNIIHYCMYKAYYRLHSFFNKLNPFMLLGHIPSVRKKFEEQGTTHLEVVNKIWADKRYGFLITISGGCLVVVLFLIIIAIFDILNSIFQYPIRSFEFSFLLCALSAYMICNLTVFKRDQYLIYFTRYGKWTKQQKWKYGFFSVVFVIGSLILFIYSFKFLPKL